MDYEKLEAKYGAMDFRVGAWKEATEKKVGPLSVEDVRNNLSRIPELSADETYETIRGLYHHNAAAIVAQNAAPIGGRTIPIPFTREEKMNPFRNGNQEGVARWKKK